MNSEITFKFHFWQRHYSHFPYYLSPTLSTRCIGWSAVTISKGWELTQQITVQILKCLFGVNFQFWAKNCYNITVFTIYPALDTSGFFFFFFWWHKEGFQQVGEIVAVYLDFDISDLNITRVDSEYMYSDTLMWDDPSLKPLFLKPWTFIFPHIKESLTKDTSLVRTLLELHDGVL